MTADRRPTLVLPRSTREEIVAAARDAAPAEACGVLGGAFDATRSRVTSAYEAENVADEPRTRYRIDPAAQLAIFERLEDRGEEIVGFYHSHPRGPAEPSETDVASAFWPDRSYVIASLDPTVELASWRWRAPAEGDVVGPGGGDLAGEGRPAARFERDRLVLE